MKQRQSLSIQSPANEMRIFWLNSQIFVTEHAHYQPEEQDRLEIVDYMLLLKECERIYEAKAKAWEK